MMKTDVIAYIASAVFLLLPFGCMKESVSPSPVEGREVAFSVLSERPAGTKTLYSGERFTAGDLERLDWVDGDLVRIACGQVSVPASKWADYSVTLTENDDQYSRGSVTVSGGTSLAWGTGTHTFYGMYPAPSTTGSQTGTGIALSGVNAVVTMSIPSEQAPGSPKASLNEDYYGDMRLAFMTAAASVADRSDVSLLFTPAVTTFYVTVKNTTGAAMNVRRVSLSSASDALTASYRALVAPDGTRTYSYEESGSWVASPARTAANSVIGTSFASAVTLAIGESLTVALFAIPEDISQLTLSVLSDETGEVSVPIKHDGSWITFTGGMKHNLNNYGVPPVSWLLTVDKNLLTYDRTGVASSAQRFTVTSSKTVGGNSRPAGWKTQIRNGSGNWVDLQGNCPAWLSGFPLNSSGVVTIASPYQEDVGAQPVVSHEARLKAGKVYDTMGDEYDNSTKAAALDLSKYNFINHRQEVMRTTANTYIVAAPGWYKIPMVYGNLIENDATVAKACKGRYWMLGHLDYFKKSSDANIYLGINYPWLQNSFLDHARIHWEKYTHWDGSAAVTTGRQWSSGSDIGVIDGLEINNAEEFLYFHVDEDLIRPGNALLAVYDDDGDCTWSWMIWITDQGMSVIPVGTNDVLPVNLGWVDDTEGQFYAERSVVLKFVSTECPGLETSTMTVLQPDFERVSTSGWQTYYQWGRKDPLSAGVTNVYTDDGTLNESIKHPSNIMYDTSTISSDKYYDWTSANYNNLWDSQNISWASPTASLPDHKTVYDPSPRGFSVPPDAAWDGFSSWGYERKEDGVFFYTSSAHDATVYFPASGYMNFTDAHIVDDDVAGYYWTSHPGQNVQRRASYSLRFDQSGAGAPTVVAKGYDETSPFTTMAFRSYGYSVRPVQYNVSASDSDVITGSTTMELIIGDEAPGWGWNADVNLKAGVTVTSGDVSIRVKGNNLLSANDPKYIASEQAIVLSNNNEMTVSVPSGRQFISISLVFTANDGSALGRADITATSSPQNGGGFVDGNGRKGHNANWNIESYTGGVYTPAANSVTFTTDGTGSSRRISEIIVTYV